MTALHVRDARHSFGEHQVFTGLDIDLDASERLFLSGGNGSGKTTLLRCLAGTLELNEGSVTIDGLPADSRAARAGVGVCLNPEQAFYLRLSGHDNLLFAARLRLPRAEVADAVALVEHELDISGFAAEPMNEYSSGMRSRVAIARALLGEPALLLLDEPTRSLDTEARELLWSALDRRSVACVIASHLTSDRERCDRVLEMRVP